MQKQITLKLLPSEAASSTNTVQYAANSLGVSPSSVTGFHIIKRSLDARGKQAWFVQTMNVFVDEPFQSRTIRRLQLKDVSKAMHKVIIAGAGPAGLFAALKLIEHVGSDGGVRPIAQIGRPATPSRARAQGLGAHQPLDAMQAA